MISISWFLWHYLGVASITAEFGECERIERSELYFDSIFTLHKHNLEKKYSFLLRNLIAGTFPIDTTKTRLQIQGQKHDQQFKNLRYKGMTDAFVKIARQEGLKALYSG